MNRFIFTFINVLFFLCSIQVNATSLSTQEARQYRAELVKKQDELLDFLLQIPFEQRQYIFPLFAAKQSVPKKIKTHPEILVWKGKRPTRIAERFKDDKELIEYLPEQFYYFLAPEMWAPEEKNILENDPNHLLQNIIKSQNDTQEKTAVIPEELVSLYNGMNILQEWVQQLGKQPDFPLSFEKWVKSSSKETQKQIKDKTGLSPSQFGKKLDLISKAYRSYKIQKIPSSSEEQKLVLEYWSLIPFIFQKTGFRDALDTSLYQD